MCVISPNQRTNTDDVQHRGPSKWLVLRAWLMLVYVEVTMHVGSLNTVHRLARKQTVHPKTNQRADSLCRAVDLACVFYFKRVLCLQRSAATVLMLRRNGLDAAMVIGVQMLPFQSHAWVEIQGRVVNDKPYVRDIYRVLELC
jgi:hypothetical protein